MAVALTSDLTSEVTSDLTSVPDTSNPYYGAPFVKGSLLSSAKLALLFFVANTFSYALIALIQKTTN